MGRLEKLLEDVLTGRADAGVRFSDLVWLLTRLGFSERIKGDHHIFTRDGVRDILNVQPRGTMAKPYQVKQVRQVILLYRLGVEQHE